jgi:hypothetical protein
MTKKELKALISHEEQMLKNWQNGDTSLLPESWRVEQWNMDKQKGYIIGLSHALESM